MSIRERRSDFARLIGIFEERGVSLQLRLKYHELFGQASHSNHKDYLFRRVAWRMQALVLLR
jgi:hypothetical protein